MSAEAATELPETVLELSETILELSEMATELTDLSPPNKGSSPASEGKAPVLCRKYTNGVKVPGAAVRHKGAAMAHSDWIPHREQELIDLMNRWDAWLSDTDKCNYSVVVKGCTHW
ncbi:MAG: hypothetical protein LBT14_09125 [Treponema sp.]|jgi:hypothetical protein|nr:hypothetical protein [Treponema sp.]